VEDPLEATTEHKLDVEPEFPPGGRGKGSQDRDGQRRGGAEATTRRQLGPDMHEEAPWIQAEHRGGLLQQAGRPRVVGDLGAIALELRCAVRHAHLDLETEPESRSKRGPPVQDCVLPE